MILCILLPPLSISSTSLPQLFHIRPDLVSSLSNTNTLSRKPPLSSLPQKAILSLRLDHTPLPSYFTLSLSLNPSTSPYLLLLFSAIRMDYEIASPSRVNRPSWRRKPLRVGL